jgi:hypothetical protein
MSFTEQLNLAEEECAVHFPGWIRDVNDRISRGAFVFEKSNPDYQGMVQGRIKDGKVSQRVSSAF